jgi:hypothetical protein
MKGKLIAGIIFLFAGIACFPQQRQTALDEWMSWIIALPDSEWTPGLTIKGNFTNQGIADYIGFYKARRSVRRSERHSLEKIYCFIVYEHSAPEDIYDIPYEMIEVPDTRTLPFDEIFNLTGFPMEELGRSIDWEGYSIGRVGDFNKNGREELYLFQLGGIGFFPGAFEFDPETKQFKKILGDDNGHSGGTRLIKVDAQRRRLVFLWRGGEGNYRAPDRETIFEWDESKQVYALIEEKQL